VRPSAVTRPEPWLGTPAVRLPEGQVLACLAPGHPLVAELTLPTPVEWHFTSLDGGTQVVLGGAAWIEPGAAWAEKFPELRQSAGSAWPREPGPVLITQPHSLVCRRAAERVSHRLILPQCVPWSLRPGALPLVSDGLFA
jgi:hypothetical protein